jgi:hypothetical protein
MTERPVNTAHLNMNHSDAIRTGPIRLSSCGISARLMTSPGGSFASFVAFNLETGMCLPFWPLDLVVNTKNVATELVCQYYEPILRGKKHPLVCQ